MKYILVEWKHSDGNYPVLLAAELDEQRWEVRKVDIYADGRTGFADAHESQGDTELWKVPVPELSEIAKNPEFLPKEISKEDFEAIWVRRHG